MAAEAKTLSTSEELLAALDNPATFERAYSEARRRLARNFANLCFGLFLLATRTGNTELELRSYEKLRYLGFGILKKVWPGYSRHPDHPHVWLERIGEVVVSEVKKYGDLQPLEIWGRTQGNEFAYLYRAFWCQFTDEWRNYYRRQGREVPLNEHYGCTSTSTVSEEERERIAMSFDEQATKSEHEGNSISAALWRQHAAYERDPEGWEATYGKFPRGLSKAVTEATGVTQRTAQRYIRALQERAEAGSELQEIRARLMDATERVAMPGLEVSADPERAGELSELLEAFEVAVIEENEPEMSLSASPSE